MGRAGNRNLGISIYIVTHLSSSRIPDLNFPNESFIACCYSCYIQKTSEGLIPVNSEMVTPLEMGRLDEELKTRINTGSL